MSQGCKPMSFTRSSGLLKSSDGVRDQFPVGLRVLAVDDDYICLSVLEAQLRNCLYEVTKCDRAEIALQLLREKKDGFDIVISDVHMPEMDGFKLLEHIGIEMDLPVIMVSADDSKKAVMKSITHGACDYLLKPVCVEALKNLWQHVVRKKMYEWKEKYSEQSGSAEDGEQLQKPSEDVDYSSTPNEGHWKNSKRRKDHEDELEKRGDTSTLKKQRVVWSIELHQQFVAAVNRLEIDKAVPKKILEIMNVPGLTRENVASHLQKYRLYLRRVNGSNAPGNSFMGLPDAAFAAMSSLNGINLQALTASHHLPRHCVTSIQTPSLGRIATKPAISDPQVDPRIKNLNVRFTEGPQLNNNVKQENLLHGVPTNVDSKQLATLQQSAQVAFSNMNLHIRSPASQNKMLQTQMVQPQPRAQNSSELNGAHMMNLPSAGQPNWPQTIPNAVLGRRDFGGPAYSSVSQTSTAVDFSSSQRTELPGNSFSLVSNPGVSTLTSKGILPEEIDSEMKGPQSFLPNYDIISKQNHQRNQDCVMQNGSSSLEAHQHPNFRVGVDIDSEMKGPQSFLPNYDIISKQNHQRNQDCVMQNGSSTLEAHQHPGFSSDQKSVQINAGFSVADGMGNQQYNNNLLCVKAERFGDIELYPETLELGDFMTLYSKERIQEGMENEFSIEDFELDHLHV